MNNDRLIAAARGLRAYAIWPGGPSLARGVDLSGNRLDLTFAGTQAPAGVMGGAEATTYSNTGYGSNVNGVTTADVSMFAWYRHPGVNVAGSLLEAGSGTNSYELGLGSTTMDGAGQNLVAAKVAVFWSPAVVALPGAGDYFVGLTIQAGTTNAYFWVNGVPTYIGTTAGGGTSSGSMGIGRDLSSGSRTLNGTIGAAMMFARYLEYPEAVALWHAAQADTRRGAIR